MRRAGRRAPPTPLPWPALPAAPSHHPPLHSTHTGCRRAAPVPLIFPLRSPRRMRRRLCGRRASGACSPSWISSAKVRVHLLWVFKALLGCHLGQRQWGVLPKLAVTQRRATLEVVLQKLGCVAAPSRSARQYAMLPPPSLHTAADTGGLVESANERARQALWFGLQVGRAAAAGGLRGVAATGGLLAFCAGKVCGSL